MYPYYIFPQGRPLLNAMNLLVDALTEAISNPQIQYVEFLGDVIYRRDFERQRDAAIACQKIQRSGVYSSNSN